MLTKAKRRTGESGPTNHACYAAVLCRRFQQNPANQIIVFTYRVLPCLTNRSFLNGLFLYVKKHAKFSLFHITIPSLNLS
jgi:hypothetical protein